MFRLVLCGRRWGIDESGETMSVNEHLDEVFELPFVSARMRGSPPDLCTVSSAEHGEAPRLGS